MSDRRKFKSFCSFILLFCLVLPILYLNATITFGSSYSAVWTNQSDFDSNAATTGDLTDRANVDISSGDILLSQNPEVSSITTVDSAGEVGWYTSIAVDSSRNVHISYYDNGSQDLKYATNAGGSWSNETLDSTGDIGKYSDIAVDSNNKVHISYFDKSNSLLKYATNVSGAWVRTTVDTNIGDGWSGSTSIAIDKNNKAHISYYVKSNGDLKYATNASGSWAKSIVNSTDDVGLYSSLALDSNNKAHINYYNKSKTDLMYSTNAAGSWSKIFVDTSGDVGWYVSNSVDSNNKVHVSYYDKSNTNLKYATNSSGSWSKTTVESSSGDVGTYSSISVDPTNKAHISYYDKSKEQLRYANNISGWSMATIDTNKTGMHTSISAKAPNRIYISYYQDQTTDSNGRDLKVFIKSPSEYNSPGSVGAAGAGLRYSTPNGEKIRWSKFRWDALIPAGTTVKAAFKTSNGDWGGSYTPFQNLSNGSNLTVNTPTPINLSSTGLNLADSSQMEIKLELSTTNGSITPQIRELRVEGSNIAAPSSSNISIFRSDGSTNIPVLNADGGWTNESSIRVKVANMQGLANSTTLKPEVEMKPIGVPFDGGGTVLGNALAAGSTGEVTVNSLTVNTSYHLRVRLIDNLGLLSDWAYFNADSKAVTMEQTSPTGRVSINNNSQTTNSPNVTLDLSSASDPGVAASGLDKVMVSENSTFSGASWQTYSPSLSYSLSSSPGKKNVFVKFKDRAGNFSGGTSFAQTSWFNADDYSSILNMNAGDSINLILNTIQTNNNGFEEGHLNDWNRSSVLTFGGLIEPYILSSDSGVVIEGNYSALISGTFFGDVSQVENQYDGFLYKDFVVPSGFQLNFALSAIIGSSSADLIRVSIYDLDNSMTLLKQWDTGYEYGGLVTGIGDNWGPPTSYQYDLSQYEGKNLRFMIRTHTGVWRSYAILDSTNFYPPIDQSPTAHGELISNIIDSSGYIGSTVWNPAALPPLNTSLKVEARAGDVPFVDTNWTPWIELINGGSININLQGKRYLQYRVSMTSSDNIGIPQFDDIFIDMPLFMDSIVLQ